ncbi:hypothetical protein D3C72_377500 [compost metagenome]
MKFVNFVGGHGSPQAGKPVHVNADAVGIIVEGQGSKPDRPVTAIHCGGFPVLVAGSVEETLSALSQ